MAGPFAPLVRGRPSTDLNAVATHLLVLLTAVAAGSALALLPTSAGPYVVLLMLVALVTVVGASMLWRRVGGPALVLMLILFDAAVKLVIFNSPLFENTTFSQPALRAHALMLGTGVALALVVVALDRRTNLGALRPLQPWEQALTALGLLCVPAAAVAAIFGNDLLFTVGDTYRLALVPLVWLLYSLVLNSFKAIELVLKMHLLVAVIGIIPTGITVGIALASDQSTYALAGVSFLAMAYLLAILVFDRQRWGIAGRSAALVVFAVMLALNVISQSRGAWIVCLMLMVGALVLAPLRAGRVVVALLAIFAVGVSVLSAVPALESRGQQIFAESERRFEEAVSARPQAGGVRNRETSIDSRLQEATHAIDDLKDAGPMAFLVGRGNGAQYPSTVSGGDTLPGSGLRHHIHVTWVSVLYRLGLLGLLLVVLVLGLAVAKAISGLRGATTSQERVLWATLLLWMPANIVYLTNVYGFIGELAWGSVLGILAALARVQARAAAERRSATAAAATV